VVSAPGDSAVTPPPRWPYAVAALGLVLDQVTKRWFVEHYALFESREVIPGFFNFTLARNTGAAFSLFDQHPGILLGVSVVIFALMVVFRDRLFSRSVLEQSAYGLIVGGVLGNLIDRTKHGYVVDFIDWYVGSAHWPIFNLADTWICTGVGLYLLSQARLHRRNRLRGGDVRDEPA
jgi:signal peptidase II